MVALIVNYWTVRIIIIKVTYVKVINISNALNSIMINTEKCNDCTIIIKYVK